MQTAQNNFRDKAIRIVLICCVSALSIFHVQCFLGESPALRDYQAPNSELDSIPDASVPLSFNRVQYTYSGQFTGSPKGQAIYSISILQTQFAILGIGDLKLKGKITPFTLGNPIPTKIRLTFRHKNAQGNLLRTKNFDFAVEPDGRILLQTFPHRDAVVVQKKYWRFLWLQ